jgi:hypothetical protein
MNEVPNPKSKQQIWIDVVKDLVGFERGYIYTLRNVYTSPDQVLESYFNNRGKYVSPFTLLAVSFSAYYLISGLLVDWDLVSNALKQFYLSFIEWEVGLFDNATDDHKREVIDKVYNKAGVPMIDALILGASKYLILIIFPMQIIILYATSLFSKKIGYGFYHHFISFNYFFSFSLLALNATILVSLISPWLMIPCLIIYNYFFYGIWLNSYGQNKSQVRNALVKGFILGFGVLIVVGVLGGMIIGRLFF